MLGHTSGTRSAFTMPPSATVSAKILKPQSRTQQLTFAISKPKRRSGLSVPYLHTAPLVTLLCKIAVKIHTTHDPGLGLCLCVWMMVLALQLVAGL
jgi:hypothetical protein